MEHLSNDHEGRPKQHENSHKLCDETGNPVVNLTENQWKLKHNMVRVNQWTESHCRTNTSIRRNGIRVEKLTI